MKKVLLMVAAVIVLSLTSCQKDYKLKGEEMAKQLDELCQQQDSAAVLMLDEKIHAMETELENAGDSAAIVDFRAALKDARQRNAAYISSLKFGSGVPKDSVAADVINDALSGDIDINAVTKSVDAMLQKEKKEKK